MKVDKTYILVAAMLVSIGVFARYWGAFDCSSCGNTTTTRGEQSFMRLNNIRASIGTMTMRVGDTVRINGGDGSNALYQLVSASSSIPWQCVLSCDVGDHIPNFVPPASGGGGGTGGGNGGDGSGSGSGGTGGGSVPGGGGGGGCTSTTTTCDENGCTTTCYVH